MRNPDLRRAAASMRVVKLGTRRTAPPAIACPKLTTDRPRGHRNERRDLREDLALIAALVLLCPILILLVVAALEWVSQ